MEAERHHVPSTGQQVIHFHDAPQLSRDLVKHPKTGADMVRLRFWDAHNDVDQQPHLVEIVYPAETSHHDALKPVGDPPKQAPKSSAETVRERRKAVKKT